MLESDMIKIVEFIDRVINDKNEIESVKSQINNWASEFPLHK